MKKLLFIISIVALVICNFYIIKSDRSISEISINSLVNFAQAQSEEEQGFIHTQVCYPCEPAPGQTGAIFECWIFWDDLSKDENCFDQDCGYGYC